MEFTVSVLDPCRTRAINSVDVTAGITLELGNTATLDFTEATDATSVAAGIYQLCGPFSYVVVDPNDDTPIDWITITDQGTPGIYTITASPILESFRDSSPNTYELWSTLDNYYPSHHAGRRDNIILTVEDATCDCNDVVWDNPALETFNAAVMEGATTTTIPAATINQVNSEAVNPKIRQCYSSANDCPETSSFSLTLSDGSSLPSFITQNSGTSVQVNALDGDALGTWTITITQTPTASNGAVMTFDSLEIVISCTIVSIDTVTPPSSGLTYTLYDTTLTIDLSADVYQQVPDCKYTLTNTFAWTIDAASPIIQDPNNEQAI
jgi:hypothetical protein